MTKEAPAPHKTKQNSPHHLCSYASLCALQIKYAIAFSSLATYSWSVLNSEIQVPSFGVKGGPRLEVKAGLECRSLAQVLSTGPQSLWDSHCPPRQKCPEPLTQAFTPTGPFNQKALAIQRCLQETPKSLTCRHLRIHDQKQMLNVKGCCDKSQNT